MSLGLALVVALAFTVEGALGFGATVVALTLGSLVCAMTSVELLPIFVPLNMALSALILMRERKHVDVALLLKRILPLMILGLPFGMLLAHVVDAALTTRAFGVVVVALALRALTSSAPARTGALASTLTLVAAGVLHGAFGTGGPLVVVALGDRLEKRAFRATLAALWLTLNVALVLGFVVDARVNASTMTTSLALSAAVIIGLVAGGALHARVPQRAFTAATWGALAVLGAVLVVR